MKCAQCSNFAQRPVAKRRWLCDACFALHQAQPKPEAKPENPTLYSCAFCKGRLQTQNHWLCYTCWSKVPKTLQEKLEKTSGRLQQAAKFAALKLLYEGTPPAFLSDEVQDPTPASGGIRQIDPSPPTKSWKEEEIDRDSPGEFAYKSKGVAKGELMHKSRWKEPKK